MRFIFFAPARAARSRAAARAQRQRARVDERSAKRERDDAAALPLMRAHASRTPAAAAFETPQRRVVHAPGVAAAPRCAYQCAASMFSRALSFTITPRVAAGAMSAASPLRVKRVRVRRTECGKPQQTSGNDDSRGKENRAVRGDVARGTAVAHTGCVVRYVTRRSVRGRCGRRRRRQRGAHMF